MPITSITLRVLEAAGTATAALTKLGAHHQLRIMRSRTKLNLLSFNVLS